MNAMRIVSALLAKEFRQILRNRFMLPIIIVIPLVQMILLTYAASLEMKDIRMAVVDQDLSGASRLLVSKFSGSPFFHLTLHGPGYEEALNALMSDRVDVILYMQQDFEKNLYSEQKTSLQLLVNAINATEAGLVRAYCTQIISDFNQMIRADRFGPEASGRIATAEIRPELWYNPLLNYRIYMFSGVLVIVVTMIGMLLTALNLVREKEMGTTEQINVTPIRKYQFIIAKLLPFWLIAMFELSYGLLLGRLLFDLPVVGSPGLLFLVAGIYLILVLGFGLMLSTISQTQQQMMFIAFFFMVTFILMSGVFTPAESMPPWAQKVNILNPVAYFMRVIRMVLLKGSGFQDISRDVYSMIGYAALVLTLAVVNYRKTS